MWGGGGGHEIRLNAKVTVGKFGGRKLIHNKIITRKICVCVWGGGGGAGGAGGGGGGGVPAAPTLDPPQATSNSLATSLNFSMVTFTYNADILVVCAFFLYAVYIPLPAFVVAVDKGFFRSSFTVHVAHPDSPTARFKEVLFQHVRAKTVNRETE